MPYPKLFLNVAPSYPLTENTFYRVLVAEAESGKEVRTTRWTFPRMDWDMQWRIADRTTEKEEIDVIMRHTRGGWDSFYWREPNLTTRNDIYIGTGTGSRTSWVLPVWVPSSFTIFVNSVEQVPATNYVVGSFAGVHSHHIIQIDNSTPTAGQVIHCSYVDGYYTPLVRTINPFKSSLVRPGYDRSEIYLTLRETKEDYPSS